MKFDDRRSGTNDDPALIEAMGTANCVIAKDTPENREVVGDTGMFFRDAEDLAEKMRLTLVDQALVERLRSQAQDRVRARYSWDAVTDAYETWFRDLSKMGS